MEDRRSRIEGRGSRIKLAILDPPSSILDLRFHCAKLIDSISVHLTSTLLAEPSFTATESPFSENSLHLRSLPPLSLMRIESLSLADERISVVSSGEMTA